MARLEISGTTEMQASLFAEADRLDRKGEEMLQAAGEIAVRAWQDAIQEAGHAPPGKSRRATGELMRSVKATAPKKTGEAWVTKIYPHGKDRRNHSLAEIAYVLHYGTSRIKGDHFADRAEAIAQEAVEREMERIWNQD